MQQQNIQKVFTFDKHFQYAGFEVIPTVIQLTQEIWAYFYLLTGWK
ncbi:hypothetical protein BGP_6034 [Beggiatoa sp. PS]|nr:hypothetical protein BGP_6034 [Beggiatoa sp. PS]